MSPGPGIPREPRVCPQKSFREFTCVRARSGRGGSVRLDACGGPFQAGDRMTSLPAPGGGLPPVDILLLSGRKVMAFVWNAGNTVACLVGVRWSVHPSVRPSIYLPFCIHPSSHLVNTYLTPVSPCFLQSPYHFTKFSLVYCPLSSPLPSGMSVPWGQDVTVSSPRIPSGQLGHPASWVPCCATRRLPRHRLETVSAAGQLSPGWQAGCCCSSGLTLLVPHLSTPRPDPRPHRLPDRRVWGRVQPEGAEGWASGGDGAVGGHPGHAPRPGPCPAHHRVPEGAAEVSAEAGEGQGGGGRARSPGAPASPAQSATCPLLPRGDTWLHLGCSEEAYLCHAVRMADLPISGLAVPGVRAQRPTDTGLWIEPCDTDEAPPPANPVVLGQTWNFSSGTGLLWGRGTRKT